MLKYQVTVHADSMSSEEFVCGEDLYSQEAMRRKRWPLIVPGSQKRVVEGPELRRGLPTHVALKATPCALRSCLARVVRDWRRARMNYVEWSRPTNSAPQWHGMVLHSRTWHDRVGVRGLNFFSPQFILS